MKFPKIELKDTDSSPNAVQDDSLQMTFWRETWYISTWSCYQKKIVWAFRYFDMKCGSPIIRFVFNKFLNWIIKTSLLLKYLIRAINGVISFVILQFDETQTTQLDRDNVYIRIFLMAWEIKRTFLQIWDYKGFI